MSSSLKMCSMTPCKNSLAPSRLESPRAAEVRHNNNNAGVENVASGKHRM